MFYILNASILRPLNKNNKFENKCLLLFLQCTVPGLIEGETYQFRVKAVNAAGPGEASKPTKPIVAKPKNLAPRIDRSTLDDIKIIAGQSFSFDVKVSALNFDIVIYFVDVEWDSFFPNFLSEPILLMKKNLNWNLEDF